jgi:membrane protease YdiL (CAAX protease family)
VNSLKNVLIVALTCAGCFFSLLLVVVVAKHFGFSPADFHDEQKIAEPITIATTLAILAIPIVGACLSQVFFVKRPIFKLGFGKDFVRFFAKGFAVGFFLKVLSTSFTYVLSPGSTLNLVDRGTDFSISVWCICFLWFLFTLVLNSFSEELVYRAFPLSNISFRHASGEFITVVATAVLFSMAHFIIEPPDLSRFLYRVAFGLLAGFLFLKNRSLWAITGLHTGWNFIALTVSEGGWKTGTLIHAMNFNPRLERELNAFILFLTAALVLWTGRNSSEPEVQ